MRGVLVPGLMLLFLVSLVSALDCHYVDKLDAGNDPCNTTPAVYHYMMDLTNTTTALAGFNVSYRYGICCNAEQSVQRFDASSNETLVRITDSQAAISCHDNPLTSEDCTYEYDIEIPGADCYPELFDSCAAGYDCVLKLSQVNISGEANVIGDCSSTYPWSMCCKPAEENPYCGWVTHTADPNLYDNYDAGPGEGGITGQPDDIDSLGQSCNVGTPVHACAQNQCPDIWGGCTDSFGPPAGRTGDADNDGNDEVCVIDGVGGAIWCSEGFDVFDSDDYVCTERFALCDYGYSGDLAVGCDTPFAPFIEECFDTPPAPYDIACCYTDNINGYNLFDWNVIEVY